MDVYVKEVIYRNFYDIVTVFIPLKKQIVTQGSHHLNVFIVENGSYLTLKVDKKATLEADEYMTLGQLVAFAKNWKTIPHISF